MNVAQLIRELEKLPPNAKVGISAHDNCEWEVAGWVGSVEIHRKSDYVDRVAEAHDAYSKDMFESQPKTWVTIRC